MSLEDFTRSYMETALWSSFEEDSEHSTSDIADSTRARMATDCKSFYEAHVGLWDDNNDATAGHDFWLTRNRHGAGFWDGDYANGDALTEHANAFGEVDLYVSESGEVYQAGTEPIVWLCGDCNVYAANADLSGCGSDERAAAVQSAVDALGTLSLCEWADEDPKVTHCGACGLETEVMACYLRSL